MKCDLPQGHSWADPLLLAPRSALHGPGHIPFGGLRWGMSWLIFSLCMCRLMEWACQNSVWLECWWGWVGERRSSSYHSLPFFGGWLLPFAREHKWSRGLRPSRLYHPPQGRLQLPGPYSGAVPCWAKPAGHFLLAAPTGFPLPLLAALAHSHLVIASLPSTTEGPCLLCWAGSSIRAPSSPSCSRFPTWSCIFISSILRPALLVCSGLTQPSSLKGHQGRTYFSHQKINQKHGWNPVSWKDCFLPQSSRLTRSQSKIAGANVDAADSQEAKGKGMDPNSWA